MKYDFDQVLDRSKLSTSKWEMEIARKHNPNLLCFGTADMDFKSSQPIIDALRTVVDNGHFGYPFKRASYYEAIIGWFSRHAGWQLKKEWIANSVAIYPSFQGLIEGLSSEGDEIIYNTPVHHIFAEIVAATKRVPIENPLKIQDGKYTFDLEDLEKKITAKSKLLILCNPHNPMGRAWTPAELSQLMSICLKHHIIVIADEVYLGLVYKDHKYTPIASLSHEASMNTVTCISPSKSFNLTGIKHSLVITENAKFREAYHNQLKKNNEYYGESIFGHAATEAAFGHSDEWSAQLIDYVAGNYQTVKKFVAANLPGVKIYEPEATYFLWMDFNCLHLSREALTAFFEDEAEVIVTQGCFLGTGGEGYIRLNLGCPRSVLEKGLARIKEAFDKHMSK